MAPTRGGEYFPTVEATIGIAIGYPLLLDVLGGFRLIRPHWRYLLNLSLLAVFFSRFFFFFLVRLVSRPEETSGRS
jgi:hypothetical protein